MRCVKLDFLSGVSDNERDDIIISNHGKSRYRCGYTLCKYRGSMRDGCHSNHSGAFGGIFSLWYCCPNTRFDVESRVVIAILDLLKICYAEHIDIGLQQSTMWYFT